MTSSALTFKRIEFKNNQTPLSFVDHTLNLEKVNGEFKVGPTQVLVKTHAVSFNPIDILIYRMISPIFNRFKADFSLGRDFSGTVLGVGDQVKAEHSFEIKDKVCGYTSALFNNATLSEYLLFDYKTKDFDMGKIPSNLTLTEAAAFPAVAATALVAIDHTKIEPHSTILVNGAGTAVGKYALSVLKQNPNAENVVAICSPRSEPTAKDLGAHHVIDYHRGDAIIEDLTEQTKINNKKFDVYLDLAGSSVLLTHLASFLKPDGYYVNIAGGKKHDITTDKFYNVLTWDLFKFTFLNKLGFNKFKFTQAQLTPGYLAKSVEIFETNPSLKPSIDKVFKFSETQAAFDYLASGKALGKVLVEMEN